MRILILSPHPFIAEMCMGGTISRLTDNHDVKVLFFSDCDIYQVRPEIKKSMESLGVKKWYLMSYRHRTMDDYRHEIRNVLWENKQQGYDRVFCPHPKAAHQDHRLIAELAADVWGVSATEIIYYLYPNQKTDVKPSVYSELTDEQLTDKLTSLKSYKSQVKGKNRWFDEQAIRSTAIYYGLENGTVFAEVFEPFRLNFI